MSGNKSFKSMSRQSDNPRIEVLLYSKETGTMETCSFYASSARLQSVDADKSAIILQDGTTISLSLPYIQLVEKIDGGASPLDLKGYCNAIIPEPEIGDKMKDGTIYAGISPDTGKPMYAAPDDSPLQMTFNRAAEYAKELEVSGQRGFRIPSKKELNMLFHNREAGSLKGTFNLNEAKRSNDCYPSIYWSSTTSEGGNYFQQFKDGNGDQNTCPPEIFRFSVRCIRD